MRLRPLTPLPVRARPFARALAGRHGRRGGSVVPAELMLAPVGRAGTAAWHLHLRLMRRSIVRVAPRLALALASAPAPPPVPPGAALAGVADPGVVKLRMFLRRTDRVRERRGLELRVVRQAERAIERVLSRTRRADGEEPPGHTGLAVALSPAPSQPPLELRTAPPPRPSAPPADARPGPAGLPAALAAFDSDARVTGGQEPPAPPAPDVERLADSVLDVIDRRVIAHRERLGRP